MQGFDPICQVCNVPRSSSLDSLWFDDDGVIRCQPCHSDIATKWGGDYDALIARRNEQPTLFVSSYSYEDASKWCFKNIGPNWRSSEPPCGFQTNLDNVMYYEMTEQDANNRLIYFFASGNLYGNQGCANNIFGFWENDR